jgi:adenosylhomocysteine nucleosidase
LSPVGIVTALPAEARTLLGRQGRRRVPLEQVFASGDVSIVVGGMGAERATAAARLLLANGARALVSWGCAGALHPGVAAGTLMLPSQVIADGRTLDTDAGWRAQMRERIGTRLAVDTRPMLDTPAILTSSVAKQAAHARHGAVAVDMESAAIGSVAAGANLPFLIVRAIADPQNLTLPEYLPTITNEFGRPRPLRVTLALLRRPGSLPKLLALDSYFRESLATLETAAELCGFASI